MSSLRKRHSHPFWLGQCGTPLRFVLFEHVLPFGPPHFDLMLEMGPRRRLWGLQTTSDPTVSRPVTDWQNHGTHRRRYLSFEGDIGQGRGSVRIMDAGRYVAKISGEGIRIEFAGRLGRRSFEIFPNGSESHLRAHFSETTH